MPFLVKEVEGSLLIDAASDPSLVGATILAVAGVPVVATAQLLVVASRVARIDLVDVSSAAASGTAAPDPALPVARLWIAAADGSPATLYLTDGARRRVYVRQVPLDSGLLDRVALEIIALIVGGSVNALVAGQEIGVSREAFAQSIVAVPVAPSSPAGAATPAAPRPSPVAPSRLRSGLLLAGYEIVRAAPVPYQHRVVVAYQSSWRQARAGVGAFAAAPQALQRAMVGARLLTAGANLTAGAHWPTGGMLDLSVGAGVGIEAVRVEPNVSTAGLRATPPSWSGALSMRGFGLCQRALTPLGNRWFAGLLVGVEMHPSPERYVIGGGQGTQVAFQAPRWRPLAGVLIGARM